MCKLSLEELIRANTMMGFISYYYRGNKELYEACRVVERQLFEELKQRKQLKG